MRFQRPNLRRVAAVVAAAFAASVGAQSPDRVLEHYTKAIGGDKKLKAIASLRATGQVRDLSTGATGAFTWEMKAPDDFYFEMSGANLSWSEGFNGRSAWERRGTAPAETLTGPRSAQLRVTAQLWNDRFENYVKNGLRVATAGQETVNGKPAEAIEVTTRIGVHRKFLFDSSSGLLLTQIEEGDGADGEIFLSDYRAVDGVLEPFHLTFKNAERTLDVTLSDVRHDPALGESAFSFPGENKIALPTQAQLLRDVEQNQKQLERLRRNYIYQMDQTGHVTDYKGKSKENEAETDEVFFLGNEEVDRLLAKDGKVLSPDEKKKEDARIDKIYSKYQGKQQKDAAATIDSKQPYDQKDEDIGIENFLALSDFSNPRMERFHGKDMLVFDFSPRPGNKPKNLRERLVNMLSGAAWIDQDAKEVVRLEARTNNNFKLDGGLLVSLQPGMYLIFEQEFVNGEVWLPSYAEVHFAARALLFLHLKGDVVVHFSNYRKFGSNVKILPGDV